MMNQEPRKSNQVKFVALAMTVALIGTVFGIALGGDIFGQNNATAESFAAQTSLASAASDLDSPFKAVYQEVSQSIVGIKVGTQTRVLNGRIQSGSSYAGSGVVISEDGYVVTNHHVIATNTSASSFRNSTFGSGSQAAQSAVASEITVVYGDEEYKAEYVAGDEDSDIAVLKVDGLNAPAAKLGNSDALSIGDWALVVGNPLGEQFANTLTVGVISGLNRDMTSTSRSGATTGTEMIQTSAAVNSGNSGGGLFNIRGELVGITSMKLSNNGSYGMASIEGIGLAIPINTVTKTVDDLIQYGKVVYPRMGISVDTVASPSDEPTKDYLPSSVLVREVEKNSPAESAGIQAYDLITEVDGQRVKTVAEMQAIIRSKNEGDTVQVTVYRVPGINTKNDIDYTQGEYLTFSVQVTTALDKQVG